MPQVVRPQTLGPQLHAIMASEMPSDLAASIERLRVQSNGQRLRKRLRDGLNGLFYLALVLFGGWVIGQAIDRTPPVSSRVVIRTPDVRPGGKLAMGVDVTRHRVCRSKVTFRLYDGESRLTVVEMPWADAAGRLGPDKPFIREITLPPDATPGDATLRIERSYRCPNNFFHEIWPITDVGPDMPFKIVPR